MKRIVVAALIFGSVSTAQANTCGIYEAIEPGDTLSGIAARCDTTLDALYAANPDVDTFELEIGGVLRMTPASADEAARAIYQTLAGNWAEDGICFGKEVIASFGPDTLSIGETGCDVGAVQIIDGAIVVKAANCQSEGEPAGSQTITITRQPGDAILYDGFSQWRFERCTDL